MIPQGAISGVERAVLGPVAENGGGPFPLLGKGFELRGRESDGRTDWAVVMDEDVLATASVCWSEAQSSAAWRDMCHLYRKIWRQAPAVLSEDHCPVRELDAPLWMASVNWPALGTCQPIASLLPEMLSGLAWLSIERGRREHVASGAGYGLTPQVTLD